MVEWEGLYEVSDHGRVRRALGARRDRNSVPGRELKARASTKGYPRVELFRNGARSFQRVHRMVLEAFVGPRPDGMECRHLDGDPSNNRLQNLCWGTSAENKADRDQHGTTARGERVGRARLNPEAVKVIRWASNRGVMHTRLAALHTVSETAARDCASGRTWAHVNYWPAKETI